MKLGFKLFSFGGAADDEQCILATVVEEARLGLWSSKNKV